MRRAVKIALALVVLGIAGLAAVYLLFFNEDSPDEFTLTPADDETEQTVPSGEDDLDGTWTVAAGSEAGYRVREKLANLPAQSDAVGRTSDVSGTVTIDGGAVTEASFEVDLTTLQSDEDRRDNRIRTSGLESDTFPVATFELTTPIEATETVGATGDLTIHGVTKSVTIPIEAARRGEVIELVGSITFPFGDFDMTPPNVGGFVTVEDDATMELKIVLERAA